MPIYEYQGKQYDIEDTDPVVAKNKILAHLGQPTAEQPKEEPSMFGMGSPVQRIAKGAIVDPALAIAQMGAGAAGAIGIPGADTAEKAIREFGRGVEAKTQAGRAERGSEGIDAYQLLGNVLGIFLPGGAIGKGATTAKGAAGAGAATSVLTQPVLDQESDLWTEKAKQASLGAVGGVVGQKAVNLAGRVLAPKIGEAEKIVRETGAIPTIGQSLGGLGKKIEDFIGGVPGLDYFVNGAKQRAVAQWNKGTIDKALSNLPDNIKVPEGVVGGDAVAFANSAVSSAYDKLYSKMGYSFGDNINKTIDTLSRRGLSKPQQTLVDDALESIVYSKLNRPVAGDSLVNAPKVFSTADGATMKSLESELKTHAYNLIRKSDGDINSVKAGEALLDVLGELKKDFYKQNAKNVNVKDLLKLDKTYSEMSVITNASERADAGIFTPKQLEQASKMNARKVSKRAFGEGRAVLQKEASAAEEILGNAKSGVVARIGGLGLFGLMANAGLVPSMAVAGGTAGIYSKGGQQVLDTLISQRPELVKKLGEQIIKTKKVGGLFGGALGGETVSGIPNIEIRGTGTGQ